MKIRSLSVAAALTAAFLSVDAQPLQLRPDNIDEIVNAMTLEEKAVLLVGGGNAGFVGGAAVGSTENYVPGAAGTTVAIERLGIPATVLTDGPAGVRINPHRKGDSNTYFATGFPVGVCLASTWNTDLVEQVGEAIGNEVLEYGCDVILAPGMNVHRSPLCGRNFEYYSEDPVLTGKIAAAYVNGVQSNGVGTSLKHFAANSQETNRLAVDEIVSPRALREIYLKGFEIAVKESKPWTVMASYNRLNGPFTQENPELLTTVLRDEWGFDGIVMTDWIGPRHTDAQIRAGNDLMEPGMHSQPEEIVGKVNDGSLDIKDVDACVRRVLSYIVKTPRYRHYAYSNKPDLQQHAAVTRQSATEGMVLLKNDGVTLPLNPNDTIALFGLTSYDFIGGGSGSGHVNRPYVIDLLEGFNNAGLVVTPELRSLYQSYKAYQQANHEANRAPHEFYWGQITFPELDIDRRAIDKQAAIADIAVITLGRSSGEGVDRLINNDFNLSEVERRLLDNVCDAFQSRGKKVVVILNVGGVIETASWKDRPDAILLAWQPGQEGGNSVADVLTGKETPSGKLSQTWPVAAMDHPSSANFPIGEKENHPDAMFGHWRAKKNVDYTLHSEGINIGYRYFDTEGKEVSYPFGYGLSYTTFAYSKPTLKAGKDGFTATVTVTNTGKVAGKEVVELYVAAPTVEGFAKPANELKAFAKTRKLEPGESQTLTFRVTDYDLASYHEDSHSWVADKGRYTVKFGASVADIRANAVYNLPATKAWETADVLHASRPL